MIIYIYINLIKFLKKQIQLYTIIYSGKQILYRALYLARFSKEIEMLEELLKIS